MASDLDFAAVDATTDFSSFVAASRGISAGEAERLIENWLKDYRPRTPRATTACAAHPAGYGELRA